MDDFIDIYCERTAAGLLNEPLNALTNGAFFIAAFLAYHHARKQKALKTSIYWLLLLIITIGIGSTLFHTLATGWAQMADIIPITLFQLSFIYLYGRTIGMRTALLLLGGFIATALFFAQLPQYWLNGSIGYMPALLFLGGLGLYHLKNQKKEPYCLLMAAGLFALSLTLRTLDMALCPIFPGGSHFLWHILNAAVLYLVSTSLLMDRYRTAIKIPSKTDNKQ